MSLEEIKNMAAYIDDYQVSDIDEAADPKYYGFLRPDGSWLIMEITTGTDVRYSRGKTGYIASWAGRALLTYDYYDEVI